jgi:hypothetical protein
VGGSLNLRNKIVLYAVAAIIAVPMFAVMSAASWFSHNSSIKSTNVQILYNTKLANGKMLEAGTYTLKIPLNTQSPELKFYRRGKLVASVPAQVKMETRKPSATELEYTRKGKTEYLTEIHPGGVRKAYILSGTGSAKSGA